MTVTMNTQVRVLLTDAGRRVWEARWARLGLACSSPPDGVLELPLWELARVFGPHLYMGCAEIPFTNNRVEVMEEDAG
jgi:hypothetical protein